MSQYNFICLKIFFQEGDKIIKKLQDCILLEYSYYCKTFQFL